MVWLMAYALSNKMANELEKFCKKNNDVVISQINWQIWFLKNNGEVLINLALLKNEDPDHFEFYAIEPLTTSSLPSKVKEVLEQKSKKSNLIINNIEELKKIKVEYERKWS
jgi:hypothetical protein